MKTFYKIIALLVLIITFNNAGAQGTQTFNLTTFASGIQHPVCIANAGDSRLFVIDQAGYIDIVDSLGNVNPQPFFDIHGRVKYAGEEGLLGIAFHPQYATNGYFYVNYVGIGDSTHISRFKVKTGNPNEADTLSEFKLMTISQPFTNHKGGNLCFGPDGYLYIGLGDGGGGNAGDPGNRAQNLMDYHGKMLRIDVNNGTPYAIPATNPYSSSLSVYNEIWASGLRNPWRFSFDKLTGDLWIGDVGQSTSEELDLQPASSIGGENYGWRCYEGNLLYNDTGCVSANSYTFPIFTYPHNPECAVIGGYVYRGATTSPYYGYYFFADYCSDRIWALHKVSGSWVEDTIGIFPGNNFSTFGLDNKGQLYIAGLASGNIYRVLSNITGIAEVDNSSEIKVVQNPFSDNIIVKTGRTDQPVIQISLCDIKGVIIYNATTEEENYEFDTSALPAGTYLLKVTIAGKQTTLKLVKAK